ncbi:MAG: hypothetical protein HY399_04065 [Elusimicrobia bacterium]|nr:hypothetical protein [Elusimicrobiota bacterium]
MRKICILSCVVLFGASLGGALGHAGESIEAQRSQSASSFQQLSHFKPRLRPRLRIQQIVNVEEGEKALTPAPGVCPRRLLHLEGVVRLHSTSLPLPLFPGHVPPDGEERQSFVIMEGNAFLRDGLGRVLKDAVDFSPRVDLEQDEKSGILSGTAWLRAYVSVFEGEKYLGTTRVIGSIPVRGTMNISGRGRVSGSLCVP